MTKQRVYELARSMGRESKELLERAHELGIDVSTASSGLDEDEAALVILSFEEQAEEAPEAVEAPPEEAKPEEPAPEIQVLELGADATPADVAEAISVPVPEVVKALLSAGHMVAVEMPIPAEAYDDLAETFQVLFDVEAPPAVEEVAEIGVIAPMPTFDDAEGDLVARPPVVTVMGHVDHGKTTLLDHIRQTDVVSGEAGGITQHIGAYQVESNTHLITFIDTPGHEAFTAMRARGANVTDIVVLVVAADDGPMPQTIEAISHARAAEVPIIVAINKIDLRDADPAAVKAQLTEHGLITEELGGDTIAVDLSAKDGTGIEQLLEMIDLVAEVEELKANPDAPASGVVVESQLDKGMGPVGTVVVQRGTLHVGDAFLAGGAAGRVRALIDHAGNRIKEAGPSTPVLIMGWGDVPTAGDFFESVENEREARAKAEAHLEEVRAEEVVVPSARERLEQLLEQLRSSDEAELRLILKVDAHGSLEAIRDGINKLDRPDASVSVLHGGVGGITENDVMLAEASDAVIVGFGVRPDAPARRSAEGRGIEIRTYKVIYELLEDVETMLVGRLAPEEVETITGVAEVRAIFRVPRRGNVAGCYVTEGEIRRNTQARLVRDGVVVYDGRIDSLRRFKDDVTSVASGFECGIGLEDFGDVKEGDVIEAYQVREVART
ncbi:MAG: translation initiation factor IF-2 [Acidimicrobiia bacterium]